jgi:phage N-6-adenine-methyltransferase
MSLVGFQAKNHPQQVSKAGANPDVDDRWTPPEIFVPLNIEHSFTLDVAASADNRKTRNYFDLNSDGLTQKWSGERVWCNPPYSDIRTWVEKAWKSMLTERAESVVMLLPSNRTEQGWWQELVEPWRDGGGARQGINLRVRFIAGRPRFFRPTGKLGGPKGDRPPFGVCVLIWTRAA